MTAAPLAISGKPAGIRAIPVMLLGMLLGAAPVWAADSTSLPGGTGKQPLNIQADNAIEWHQDQKAYVARGHASAVRGTSTNPMTRAEVDAKSHDLLAPVLGRARARRLCDTVWNLEKLSDIRRLRPLLQA